MASYEILINRDAEKEIRAFPKADIARIVKKILTLANNPRPHGSEKLKGKEGYRIREGLYRIVYIVDDAAKKVTIVKTGHRKEVYR